MKFENAIRNIKEGIVEFFFPHCCAVCEKHLVGDERFICDTCFHALPRVRMQRGVMSEVDDLFLGCRIVKHGVSFFKYSRYSKYSEIIKDIKYRNKPEMGTALARIFAQELLEVNYFDGIDIIVPIPLHRKKQRERGYNQSWYIAKGVSEISGLPIEEVVEAVKPHKTQTAKTADQRKNNVKGVFGINKNITGKQVLLIDDVITTGATLMECCDELEKAGVRGVKILSLALAER